MHAIIGFNLFHSDIFSGNKLSRIIVITLLRKKSVYLYIFIVISLKNKLVISKEAQNNPLHAKINKNMDLKLKWLDSLKN